MARQVNSGDPSSGFPSKETFNQNGSICDADLTVFGVKDSSKTIVFDASAQTSGKSITIAAGANSANIVLTLPTTSGTLSTGALTNPMTTGGDIIYGGASGVPTRLANGSNGQVLTSSGTTAAPTWAAAGGSAPADSTVVADTPSGHGSTGTKIRKYSHQVTTGSDITYTSNPSNQGDTFTINTTGRYAITLWDTFDTGGVTNMGISVNAGGSNDPNGSGSDYRGTNIASIPVALRLAMSANVASNQGLCCTTRYFVAGDIVRAHDKGELDDTGAYNSFIITRVS